MGRKRGRVVATERPGRSWLRSGGGRLGREAGGRAFVQGGRIFVRMLLVAIARRELQTEGLSSPPSGLGAEIPGLSQNKSAGPAWHPFSERVDNGLLGLGWEETRAPSWDPDPLGTAKQATAGAGG